MERNKILESIRQGDNLKGFHKEINNFLNVNERTLVILDDDPTGTQTMHDVPVITDWGYATVEYEIKNSPIFFILTNSRGIQANEAKKLAHSLGLLLSELAKEHRKKLVVISRGDSTLRGHYPYEVDALIEGLGWKNTKQALIPAFFQGGRYTYQNVHYVKEQDDFIPVGDTNYAKDASFGFKASNLVNYIQEKYNDLITEKEVVSFSTDQLRNYTTIQLINTINETNNKHIVVNATSHADLEHFAMASLQAKTHVVYRTAASFVNAITGIKANSFLVKENLLSNEKKSGALIIIGSYVTKSTQQLKYLKKKNAQALFIKMEVGKIFADNASRNYLKKLVKIINNTLATKKNVVLYTSRKVYLGNSKEESLEIINRVSEEMISLVKLISVTPHYILAKGGITSSDICVKALGVRKALVMGQIIKGVPVWKLDKASKHPYLPYIVFPGNVGEIEDLHKLIKVLE